MKTRRLLWMTKLKSVLFFLVLVLLTFLELFVGITLNAPGSTRQHQHNVQESRLPKIVFAAVFRNTNARNPIMYRQFLEMASAITSEYHVVIYENDSKDDTRDILLKNLGKLTHVTMLFEDESSVFI